MATNTPTDNVSGEELQFHPSHTYSQHEVTAQSVAPKSPLLGSLFKHMIPSSSLRADGTPAKRRGPKPDSKPAINRRQELNRQAQRTHRERKELYMKALEDEVHRLKELYQNTARERDSCMLENKKLRELLQQYGIPVPPPSSKSPATGAMCTGTLTRPGLSSSGSFSGSYPPASAQGHSRSPPINGGSASSSAMSDGGPGMSNLTAKLPGDGGIDYATVGVDFVTSYERGAPYPSPPPN